MIHESAAVVGGDRALRPSSVGASFGRRRHASRASSLDERLPPRRRDLGAASRGSRPRKTRGCVDKRLTERQAWAMKLRSRRDDGDFLARSPPKSTLLPHSRSRPSHPLQPAVTDGSQRAAVTSRLAAIIHPRNPSPANPFRRGWEPARNPWIGNNATIWSLIGAIGASCHQLSQEFRSRGATASALEGVGTFDSARIGSITCETSMETDS